MKLTSKQSFPFDQQVPIYNWFYPLCYDENLSDYTSSNVVSNRIRSDDIKTRSLYFHIPFCDTICSFCPFVRGKFDDESILEDYTNALMAEIRIKSRNFQYTSVPINSIFFGGGTPSIISASQIRRIGQLINDTFDTSSLREFSYEMEVKSVTDEKLSALKDIGVTHGRFGLQTFNKKYRDYFTLTATIDQCIGRLHDMMRYFDHVSFDVLYGMNGQTFDDLAADILSACATRASNIDIYPVNNLSTQLKLHKFYENDGVEPLSAMTKHAMREFIDDIMRSEGYTPHNGHGYIRNDLLSIADVLVTTEYQFEYHKSVYGYEDSDTLGFGVSAMTNSSGLGYENHGNRKVYIESMLNDGDVACRYRTFTKGEVASKPIIMHLPYFGHLDKGRVDWSAADRETVDGLSKMVEAGLVQDRDHRFELSRSGWLWYTNMMFYLHREADKAVLRESFERREKQPGRKDGKRHFLIPETAASFA